MMAVCSALATRSGVAGSGTRTTLAVIPAKAGIHVDGCGLAATTPNSSAVWGPAFAGMTTEGVGVDSVSSLCTDIALNFRAGCDRATRSGVIPAKAGIHADRLALADGMVTPTSNAPAVWIPAFAGMTAEGAGDDTAFPLRADRDRATRSGVIPIAPKNSRAR